MHQNVPLVDLKAQYRSLKPEMDSAIHEILDSADFIGGNGVAQFEEAFARAVGVPYCVGVANGTDAIFIALKCLGVGPGDEVITVANSFIATSEAIGLTGATSVFVDCDPKTYTIDIHELEKTILNRKAQGAHLKAIVPVHLYGRPADMVMILNLAKQNNLKVIEDAAQAHLAQYRGQNVGTFGQAACFSFYPGKNLGAYGDAGAIVTYDETLAKKMRMFANHGRIAKYDHEIEGINSRLDAIQAAVLRVKLPYLSEWTQRRQKNARLYQKYLQGVEAIILPEIPSEGGHVFHLYVTRVKERDRVQKALAEWGVSTGVHYPIALPYLKAYGHMKVRPDDLPVASRYQNEILSLPMYPELTEDQIAYVAHCLKRVLAKG